jgi:hypothetical protein
VPFILQELHDDAGKGKKIKTASMSTLAKGQSMYNWSQLQSGTKGDQVKIMNGSSTYLVE